MGTHEANREGDPLWTTFSSTVSMVSSALILVCPAGSQAKILLYIHPEVTRPDPNEPDIIRIRIMIITIKQEKYINLHTHTATTVIATISNN